ncbi:beta-lactamase family protein [Marinilongibacter aquaticus]|uniref:serine hydrolase domain-containing protein n=1 Tax=Marinilongibacter aquaticus TaxID=2975157 RepID=UPI0021BD62BA|nr:serine hydrolase domain-containing protein [Marinilongibacter aquaticus]UBM59631.1 beta-lactamase family protein [Marinilongibacter aquaticus]
MKTKILLFLLWAGPLLAQETVESQLTNLLDKYQAVGLSVAVVKKGELIYTKALGKKNLTSGEALESDDIFRIASISKSFSSTSIMQLVEAGKLKLTDDVSDLVGFKVRNPKYPDVLITLKMLLSHTSSLNDSEGYFTLDPANPEKNPNWEKCYNDYAPGKGYMYCNLNFNMVGTIIEKYSGERFDQYVKNHVLQPLGLYGGYCVDSLDSDKFAGIYEFDADKKAYEFSEGAYHPRREIISNYVFGYTTPVFSPTGGMKISAPDLARYMSMHMQYGKSGKVRIISKKHAKLMQTPVSDNGYGLALLHTESLIPGEDMVGHTGSAYGLYSSMFFNPKEKFGIVAITNGCRDCVDEHWRNVMLQEVTRLLYQDLIK